MGAELSRNKATCVPVITRGLYKIKAIECGAARERK